MMNKITVFFYTLFLISPLVFAAKYSNVDEANQKAILYYVNAYRAKHHLKPLIINNLMSQEAAKHSRDMATHAIPFGHKHFDKRIHRLFTRIKECKGGSENVAFNYKDGKDVVKNWLTSPGHRRNIEGNFNLTGIGIARDKRGKIYFTQLFIRTTNPIYLNKKV